MRTKCSPLICRCALIIIVAGSVLPSSALLSPVRAQRTPGAMISVLESSPQHIVVELAVGVYEIETVEHAGEVFQRVRVQGATEFEVPGAPRVPILGAMLGVPSTSNLSVRIIDANYDTRTSSRPYPSPQFSLAGDSMNAFGDGAVQELFALDESIYARDAFYPGGAVSIGTTGLMRDQPVVQVQFFPVQFNPVAGEVRLYRRIQAEVTWEADLVAAAADRRTTSTPYENVMQSALLNYDSLPRPEKEISPSPMMAAADAHPADASDETLKLTVNEDGLYQVTSDALTVAGLNLNSVDPRNIKVHNQGRQIPILIIGESDGVFDPGDTVLFYGTAIKDVYTAANVYWLSVGETVGKRMSQRNGMPSATDGAPHRYPLNLHAEEDTAYWQNMLNGENQDHWFWGKRISPNTGGMPASRSYSVTLQNIATDTLTATIKVSLKGYTSLAHRTKIHLNGTEIDDQQWEGQVIFGHEIDVDHSLLKEGENEILVETVDTGAFVDQILVDWIEIDCWKRYVAEGDELLFLAPQAGKYRFEVDGFTSTDVMVFDITDPANVGLITATQIVSGSIGNKLIFGDNTSAVNQYLALTAAQIRPTASVEMDRPSTWRSPENGADYIVITYDGFYSNTLPLANHRRASGLRVAVAQVSDLYDEFNHGIFNPKAIRDFLGYAYQNWTPPAPVYVLLVGDAYLDYQDRMGLGKVNYVPSQIIETIAFGETSSDSWYSAVSGDDILPDMFIGRLTARTTHEVDYMVDSIIQYDQRDHAEAASWHKNVLLVADDDEPTFESISEQLADRLPFYYTLNRVYANNYPPNNPTTDIQTAIEDGSVLVNYSGHGEYYRWGKWNAEKDFILQLSDIDAMDNPGRLPIVTVANCLNGFFVGPQVSMAEAFQHQPGKGAIAVWAPTNLGFPEGHRVLLSEFYTAVFQNDHLTMGAATTLAKINTFAQSLFWGEMIETYVLFGDPATKIGIPTNYPYVELTSPAHEAKDVALDQELRVVFSKPISTSTVILTGKGIDQLTLTPSWSSDDTVATFSHTEFEHGKTYEFSAIGQDRLGNLLGPGQAPSTWSFTVSDDDIQPTASVGEPSFDGGRVSIPVLFGEPMRKDSVVYTLIPASEGDLDWGTGGVAATFRTATNLVPGQTYTFTLSAGMDLAGNTLAAPIQKSFTVSHRSFIYLPKVLK